MQQQRNRSKKNTRGPRRPRQQRNVVKSYTRDRPDHPGEIGGYEITHNRRLRFTCTAAVVNQAISFQNLLDLILVATTTIAPFQLFDLVRIRSAQIWGQAALGTPSSVALSFDSATGDRTLHQDTSLGIKPAYIKAVPSPKSLVSFFNVTTGGQAFLLTCPAGSIIDLDLQFRDIPGQGTAATNASVAAPVGSIFYRGLDGLAAAGTNFPVPAGVFSF